MDNRNPTRLNPLERDLLASWPRSKWVNVKVLLAVSGGPDSVALARSMRALHDAPSRLTVAHFNHQLRGAASDDDQAFVEQLSRNLSLDCIVGSAASRPTRCSSDVSEADARQQRYDFLVSTAKQIGARYVATGHTADDQAETVLHHILRGTGLAGLAGIPRIRRAGEAVTIVRPLLSSHRHEILEYLRHLDQAYRHDETNDHHSFTRNRIRHELMPQLQRDYNAEVVQALLRLSQIAAESHSVMREMAGHLLETCVLSRTTSEVRLATAAIEKSAPHLRRECFVVLWQQQEWPLQSMNFAHWQKLAEIAVAPQPSSSPTLNLPGHLEARRSNTELTLTRRD